MPMPEGPSSVSPEFPTTGEDAALPSHPGKPGVIAPWLSMTPRLDESNCEKRNPGETHAALKRLLRIAEHESGTLMPGRRVLRTGPRKILTRAPLSFHPP